MKYALIKDTMKVVSIKEVEIDKINFTVNITSMKDEVYTEQYLDSDETLNRLLGLNVVPVTKVSLTSIVDKSKV